MKITSRLTLSGARPLAFGLACAFLVSAVAVSAGPRHTHHVDFEAHEWGTFTSIQGSDGRTISWDPFEVWDLPNFVYSRTKPGDDDQSKQLAARLLVLGAKNTRSWIQRMETPVIYFYADKSLEVDVTVKFPQGLLTEWYPNVAAFGPVPQLAKDMPGIDESLLTWKGVRIQGRDGNWRGPQKAKIGGQRQLEIGVAPPIELGPNHYYAARVADSNLLTVSQGSDGEGDLQAEKFLFYRGAGDFQAPLQARFSGPGRLRLHNKSKQPLGDLFVFRRMGGKESLVHLPGLEPDQEKVITLPEADGEASTRLKKELALALEHAGLFAAEARSMLLTWEDSWFEETGLRVLYLISESWTDAVLPLDIQPRPRKTVRVMVGRAELLSPEVEQALEGYVDEFVEHPRPEPIQSMQSLVAHRFLEPALSRVHQIKASRIQRQITQLKAAANPNDANKLLSLFLSEGL